MPHLRRQFLHDWFLELVIERRHPRPAVVKIFVVHHSPGCVCSLMCSWSAATAVTRIVCALAGSWAPRLFVITCQLVWNERVAWLLHSSFQRRGRDGVRYQHRQPGVANLMTKGAPG